MIAINQLRFSTAHPSSLNLIVRRAMTLRSHEVHLLILSQEPYG